MGAAKATAQQGVGRGERLAQTRDRSGSGAFSNSGQHGLAR